MSMSPSSAGLQRLMRRLLGWLGLTIVTHLEFDKGEQTPRAEGEAGELEEVLVEKLSTLVILERDQ